MNRNILIVIRTTLRLCLLSLGLVVLVAHDGVAHELQTHKIHNKPGLDIELLQDTFYRLPLGETQTLRFRFASAEKSGFLAIELHPSDGLTIAPANTQYQLDFSRDELSVDVPIYGAQNGQQWLMFHANFQGMTRVFGVHIHVGDDEATAELNYDPAAVILSTGSTDTDIGVYNDKPTTSIELSEPSVILLPVKETVSKSP